MKYTLPFLVFGLILFSSCSKSAQDKTSKDYLSAYLNGNDQAIVFGKVDLDKILEKADYKSIPKVNVLLNEELVKYRNALDLEQGIHFALEGPFDDRGELAQGMAIAKVKNADSLASKITSLGLLMEESGDMRYTQDNEMMIGIKDHLALFVVKKGTHDVKSSLEAAFTKCEGDPAGGKIEQALDQTGDITFGINLESSYRNTPQITEMLDDSKKKELEALVTDSYIMMAIQFGTGEAVITSKNLFSDALANRMFLEEDPQQKVISKLGLGKAWAGISVNMDSKKMENFVKDFSPEMQREIEKMSSQLTLFSFTPNKNQLASLWNGKLGLAMVGEMVQGGGMVPELNFSLGLGSEGSKIAKKLASTVNKNIDGKIEFNGIQFTLKDKEVSGTTIKDNSGKSKLKIPGFANDFGKKGLSGFVNFSGLDVKSLDLDDEAKAINALKSLYFEVDNKGSKLVLKAKKSSTNILKQIVNVYMSDVEARVN